MDKSQMRVRPGFVLGCLLVFFALAWFVSTGVPTEKEKTKAKILETRLEASLIAELLGENAVKVGGLTNIANEFVLNSLRTTNEHQFSFASRTNASGEVVDVWQTAFQIGLAGQTNFVISSAGPNLKFGDKDDIIFKSISNDFVKP